RVREHEVRRRDELPRHERRLVGTRFGLAEILGQQYGPERRERVWLIPELANAALPACAGRRRVELEFMERQIGERFVEPCIACDEPALQATDSVAMNQPDDRLLPQRPAHRMRDGRL